MIVLLVGENDGEDWVVVVMEACRYD